MSTEFPDALADAIANRDVLPEFEGERSLYEAYRLQHEVTWVHRKNKPWIR